MSWRDSIYDWMVGPTSGSEAANAELAAQAAMPPAVRRNYWEGLEMPPDPRMQGYRMGEAFALDRYADEPRSARRGGRAFK
jgi:hypothetical protein